MKKPDKKTPVEPVSGASHNTATLATHRKAFKRLLLVVISVLLVVGVAFTAWQYRNKLPHNLLSRKPQAPACSNPTLLHEAAAAFDPSKHDQLQQVANKVMKTSKYDKDPNCLYIMVKYDISIADAKNARDTFNKLQKIYDPKSGFNKELGSQASANGIAGLQSEVEFLEKASDQVLKNATTIHDPGTKQ